MKDTKARLQKVNVPWYRSIVFKQMMAFVLMLLPIVCFYWLLFDMYQDKTIDNITQLMLSSDTVICDMLDNRLDNIKLRQIELIGSYDTQVLSDLWKTEEEKNRVNRAGDIQKRLSWMCKSNEMLTDIELYLTNAGIMLSDTLVREMTQEDYEIVKYAQSLDSTVFTQDGQLVVFSVLSNLWDGDYPSQLCTASINNHEIGKLLWGSILDETEAKILFVNGDPFLSRNISQKDIPDKMIRQCEAIRAGSESHSLETLSVGEEKYLCIMVRSAQYDITIASLHPYERIVFENRRIKRVVPIFISVILLVALLFLLYFKGFIERPIRVLCDAFKDMVNGRARVIHTHNNGNEFNRLYDGFNELNRLLKEKTEQVYLKEIEMQKSRLKQLQAQIDPHFLFNSLFIVKAKIWNKDYEGSIRLTELLGEYFRFLNRDTNDLVSLEAELNHAYVYANIQNTRFSGRFDMEWKNCPPEFRNITIPRLVIQPLIENVIKYGFDDIEENGLLRLYFEKEESRLKIVIEGSGTGITIEKINTMNERLNIVDQRIELTSTINIHRRLQLFYGSDCGIQFFLSELGGVKTVLSIAVAAAGKEHYDEQTDGGFGR